MGLLDRLFGGGTKLELRLDMDKLPPGGTVAGTVSLSGGKKPLRLAELKVELVCVRVVTREGQALPSVNLQVLTSDVLAGDRELAPGSLHKFGFRHKLPDDLKPDATYKVMARADIPGVKDPGADVALTIISTDRSAFSLVKSRLGLADSEDEVLGRYPGLTSRDEHELRRALHELQRDAYDRDNNFTGAHAFLLRLVESHTSGDVRRAALAAWGTVLDDRARPEHIRALETLAARDLPADLMEEVVSVAAKFAEEGALPLVQRLAHHPQPAVRERLAACLHLDADRDLPGRRDLILALCRDGDASVRAAAYAACASLVEDLEVARHVAAHAAHDPSPAVQKACIASIALAYHHGGADLVFATYLAHARHNPHASVRQEVAESLHWLPVDPRLTELVALLLQDGDSEVRRAMAWQSCNMGDHPELRDLFLAAATGDPDAEVRADALRGVDKFMSLPDAVAFLRQRLAVDRNDRACWAALGAVEGHMPDEHARGLLQEIAAGPLASPAERAREILSGA